MREKKEFTRSKLHYPQANQVQIGQLRTAKGDRRTIVIRSSDEKVGDTQYFNQYYAYLDNRDVVQACYDYLTSLDVATFHQLKNQDVPLTEFQRDLQTLAVSPIATFIEHIVSDELYERQEEILLSSAEMLREFQLYCSAHNIKYDVNAITFGIRLKNLNIAGVETGVHTWTGNKIRVHRRAAREHFGLDRILLTPYRAPGRE